MAFLREMRLVLPDFRRKGKGGRSFGRCRGDVQGREKAGWLYAGMGGPRSLIRDIRDIRDTQCEFVTPRGGDMSVMNLGGIIECRGSEGFDARCPIEGAGCEVRRAPVDSTSLRRYGL